MRESPPQCRLSAERMLTADRLGDRDENNERNETDEMSEGGENDGIHLQAVRIDSPTPRFFRSFVDFVFTTFPFSEGFNGSWFEPRLRPALFESVAVRLAGPRGEQRVFGEPLPLHDRRDAVGRDQAEDPGEGPGQQDPHREVRPQCAGTRGEEVHDAFPQQPEQSEGTHARHAEKEERLVVAAQVGEEADPSGRGD